MEGNRLFRLICVSSALGNGVICFSVEVREDGVFGCCYVTVVKLYDEKRSFLISHSCVTNDKSRNIEAS